MLIGFEQLWELDGRKYVADHKNGAYKLIFVEDLKLTHSDYVAKLNQELCRWRKSNSTQ